MTRRQFIEAYATGSGLDVKTAPIGLLKVGDTDLIALPCACGEDGCEGWAMLGASAVLHHLAFHAPAPIREAYCEAIGDEIA